MAIVRFSVSLEQDLVDKFDRKIKAERCPTRSKAVGRRGVRSGILRPATRPRRLSRTIRTAACAIFALHFQAVSVIGMRIERAEKPATPTQKMAPSLVPRNQACGLTTPAQGIAI